MIRPILTFLFVSLLTSLSSYSQVLDLTNANSYELRCKSFVYFEDVSGKLLLENIKRLPEDSFNTYDKNVLNFGYTQSSYWIKTKVVNHTEHNRLYMEIGQANTDLVELHVDNKTQVVSDLKKFSERNIKDPTPTFILDIAPGDEKDIYIKIQGADELVVPIHMGSQELIVSMSRRRDTLFGVFAGILAVMILYNLFLFLSLRTKIYFLYVMFILPLLLGQSSLLGYSNKFFWPNSDFWPNQGGIVFPLLTITFGVIFASRFINLKRYIPWAVWPINVFVVISLAGATISIFGYTTVGSILLNATGMISALFIIVICAILTNQRVSSAKFLLVAWTIFLTGVIFHVLRSLNILDYNFLTSYSMPIGSAFETVLLSFALADRINTLKKQREESQRLMLLEVKKNNDLTRNQNMVLEEKVHQRTLELEVMNSDLEETLSNLKSTQGHLIEAEKMASLGHLTAGIAHEINNPINYVSSNVEPLRQDLGDILSILNDYKEAMQKSGGAELKSLQEKEQELDIEYSIKEMKDLLNGIEEGARRTSEIVTGLKNFSRTDEDEAQSADINNGLQSTITILKSELKDINCIMELGQIPHIKCYLGKLNQVFMNLIDNAIDAIKERFPNSTDGELLIRTEVVDENVLITIKDNGCGMPEEVSKNIFDPFFTTKDVGKGTGLGLSITYGIMEKHNGHISVESKEDVGTTFLIELPITY